MREWCAVNYMYEDLKTMMDFPPYIRIYYDFALRLQPLFLSYNTLVKTLSIDRRCDAVAKLHWSTSPRFENLEIYPSGYS